MTTPTKEHVVQLFRNGRNQALRIPRELEFNASQAILRKDGDRLIVEPIPKRDLLALLLTLEPIADDFADVDVDLLPLRDHVL
jgi:antitoxin VapB